jgi:hypothetical protein
MKKNEDGSAEERAAHIDKLAKPMIDAAKKREKERRRRNDAEWKKLTRPAEPQSGSLEEKEKPWKP